MPSEEEAAEGRPSRRRHGSPGQDGLPVTVVYYLCRSGRHLEHPHLKEMHLASPNQALYLRDVIHRLDALRGKGMAAMYSWSCKRRYKTGFVWHDVLDDDMLLPAQGNEYVLKGSLLLLRHASPPALVVAPAPEDHDLPNVGTTIIPKVPCVKPTTDEESPTHPQEDWTTNSPSSSPPTVKAEDEAPPPPPAPALHQGPQQVLSSISPSSSCTTGDRDTETASARSSCSASRSSPSKPATGGSAGSAPPASGSSSSITPPAKATVPTNDKQPENAGSLYSGTRRKSGTLESLIRAEALGRRGATAKRILEEEHDDDEALQSLGAKLNPANLLMRLVACGSTISARQHHPACGLTRTAHKPQYLTQHVELLPSSPVLSPLGALILRHGSAAGNRVVSDSGDCDNCRGNLHQATGKWCESGKVMSTIVQPSLSHEHDSVPEDDSIENLNNLEGRNKISPQTIGMAPCQQPTGGTLVTITTNVRREQESKTLSRSTSKRMINPSSQSSRVVSFHDEKDKVNKIEERLASGAHVIIQCEPLVKETYISAKTM